MAIDKPASIINDSVKGVSHATIEIHTTVTKPVHHLLKTDTAQVIIRQLNSRALKQYANDPDFDYYQEKSHATNWWEKFWEWFWHLLQNSKQGEPEHSSSPYLGYIFWAVIGGFVLFVIIKFATSNGINIFNRGSMQINGMEAGSIENIHQVNFDEEIEKAVAQTNYRLAVRLLYLLSLKQLNDAGLINWRIEKTNSTYLNELKDADQRRVFATITRQFEYVWYGEFAIDNDSFQNIHGLFKHFKQMLP